ncbi:DUF305 domain-containing protein [Arsenicicoccus dermatophilus]|uniref:DUF305 domain-containing protein n=1 Tax=Arsenicicoccus dermatophilus TaxID=1076331 RepID=UPI001F4CDC31|nr:DUF305 domain-containing protein [Arsenicicoccus dermatophilus]MCH8614307.1 DUF305 domain-containing protein [Arsenicicoccus dermatophilus]
MAASSRLGGPARVLAPLALSLALAGCGGPRQPVLESAAEPTPTPPATRTSWPTPATQRERDLAFLSAMVPHCNQTHDVSRIALSEHDASPDVQWLARRLLDDQHPQVVRLRELLGRRGASVVPVGEQAPVPGRMSEQDVTELLRLRGTDFDRRWLELMITHAEGASRLATTIERASTDPEVREVARDTVNRSRAALGELHELLARPAVAQS